MSEDAGEKSHDATAHRRQQAREEGQVAQSQDLGAALLLLTGLVLLLTLGKSLAEFFFDITREHLGGEVWIQTDIPTLWHHSGVLSWELAKVLLPILGLMLLLAVGVNLGQVGILFLPDKLMPDLDRINPLSGLKRIFSLAGLVRLAFGILKIVIVSVVAYWVLYGRQNEILMAAELELPVMAAFMVGLILWTSIKVAFALVILAVLDYGFQRWKYEQDLKMTNQEMREEMRNMTGDPHVIARRRQVQRQLVMNRLSAAVPKADVVVTNPTELAVALQYDANKMAAPIVVAKGAGAIAQRIRRLALENNIPIVERKPLAQLLFKDVKVNHPVPDKQYAAVAEVLAYVYQLKGKPVKRA